MFEMGTLALGPQAAVARAYLRNRARNTHAGMQPDPGQEPHARFSVLISTVPRTVIAALIDGRWSRIWGAQGTSESARATPIC
jgi:hypothetical protein